jgi:hypothetical protein
MSSKTATNAREPIDKNAAARRQLLHRAKCANLDVSVLSSRTIDIQRALEQNEEKQRTSKHVKPAPFKISKESLSQSPQQLQHPHPLPASASRHPQGIICESSICHAPTAASSAPSTSSASSSLVSAAPVSSAIETKTALMDAIVYAPTSVVVRTTDDQQQQRRQRQCQPEQQTLIENKKHQFIESFEAIQGRVCKLAESIRRNQAQASHVRLVQNDTMYSEEQKSDLSIIFEQTKAFNKTEYEAVVVRNTLIFFQLSFHQKKI